jgi:hypothetical protein
MLHRPPTHNVLSIFLALCSCLPCLAADPGEDVLYAWDFEQADDTLGWSALHSVAPLSIEDGSLACRVSGSDPFIASPPLEGVTVPNALIRVVYRSTLAGGGQIFWAADTDPADARFQAGDAVGIRFEATTEWTVLHAGPEWEPGLVLRRLRIDFPEGVGEVVEIQRVELVARPIPEGLPAEPRYDFAQPGLAMAFVPGPGMGRVYGEDERLVCELAGDPAMVYSPAFALDSEQAGIASLGVRVDGPARIEVLFKRAGTSLFPPGEGVGIDVDPSEDFRTLNLDLRTVPEYTGEIERLALRVWPEEAMTRLEVRSLAIVDRPRGGAWLHVDRVMAPGVVANLGPTLNLTCVLRNVGGTGSEGAEVLAQLPPGLSALDEVRVAVPTTAPLETTKVVMEVPAAEDFEGGWVDIPVEVTGGGRSNVRVFLAELPGPEVTGAEPTPAGSAYLTPEGDAVMSNGQLTAVFPHSPAGFGAGVLFDASGDEPRRVGSFPSLGLVTSPEGSVERIYSGEYPLAASGPEGAQISFPVNVALASGSRSGLVRYMLRPGASELECVLQLDAGEEVGLAGLVFPEFLAGDGAFGPDRDLGVFPGLEYLLPGEVSSDSEFVRPPGSLRYTPHPYKVTMPAMWVTSRDRTVGLRWDPVQDWSGGGLYPTPLFASPDRLLDTPAHRLGLLTPGVLGGGAENSLALDTPLTVASETPITIGASVFSLADSSVETACRYVLSRLAGSEEPDAPPIPEPAPSRDTMIERAAYGLAETLWIPEERLWHPNLPDAHGPRYSPAFAHVLWFFARTRPGSPHADTAETVMRQAIEAQRERGRGLGWDMAFGEGSAEGALRGIIGQGRHLASTIREDGTWPFIAGTELRQSFGVDGDTSSGLVAANAARCLWAAAISSDEACLEAGLQALAYLDTQSRPEGAQTWELSLHVPDILTCAHAVRAYTLAYRLTAESSYLLGARRWAWRAVPFVYVWAPEERPIMRYGSIPVFGATHFDGAWFGRIVQWNGLAVAEAMLDLAEHDDTFDWRAMAEGILISAGQQMRPLDRTGFELAEYVPDTDHPGLYPDAYSAVKGTDAYTWDLEASPIARLAGRLESDAGWARTEVVRIEDRLVSVSGLAEVLEVTGDADSVELTLSLPPELGAHTVALGWLDEPVSVSAGPVTVERVAAGDVSEPGTYRWLDDESLVLLRLAPAGDPVVIRVTW